MTRQKIVVEEGGYRTEDVEGAKVTAMGIVQREKGGNSAFIDFDDGKGMATYNLTAKDDEIGSDADDGSRHIPGFFDFGKINKALQKLGYESYIDRETNEWGTEPSIIDQQIWIKCIKTSTSAEGKEYKSLIDVTKIGSDEIKPATPAAKGSTAPAKSTAKPTPPPKGTLTPELLEDWRQVLGQVLTEPLNETGINMAVKKLFPDEATGKNATHRKALADVRNKALQALVKDGTLEMDENAKYSISL